MLGTVKVGIIGAGNISSTMHIPVLRAMQGVTIQWVGDVDVSLANEVAKSNGLTPIFLNEGCDHLPEVDVVLLAIPLPPRDQYFDFFENSDSVVFAEKPLVNSSHEHRKLMLSYEPWRIAVGYQRRYYASSLLLRKLIRSGVFGHLLKVVLSEGGRVTRAGGTGSYMHLGVAEGGGIIKNLGCHSIDLAFWLTGASGALIRDRSIQWDADADRKCRADIQLLNINGVSGAHCDFQLEISWLDSQSNTIEFHFGNFFISCPVSPTTDLQLRDFKRYQLTTLDCSNSAGALTSSQAFFLEWSDVITAFQSKAEQPNSARSTLATSELIDELLER